VSGAAKKLYQVIIEGGNLIAIKISTYNQPWKHRGEIEV
jgi:hypothetical protein